MTDVETQHRVAEEFERDAAEFDRKTRELGLGDLSSYYWYHTVELPLGLVTPGQYDFRRSVRSFPFPDDMRGMRVLDVGSATGFFAFEFERRGAEVVSVELPSLFELDRFPGQRIEQIIEKIEKMMGPKALDRSDGVVRKHGPEQLYFYLLEGPFEFCRKALGSRVGRCHATVYDLPAKLEEGAFDLVFMGDILLHTLHPLSALASVAPLCRGELVISQVMPEATDGKPVIHYMGGDSLDSDEVSWWWPNQPCLAQLLRKLGFREVTEAGHHTGMLRPSGYEFDRTILRAVR